MNEIDIILDELSDRNLNERVRLRHNDAKASYAIRSNRVRDSHELLEELGRYYNHHQQYCFGASRYSDYEAQGRARGIVDRFYHQKYGEGFGSACDDAISGDRGGLDALLGIVRDGIREEDERLYMQGVFDRYVASNSYDEKVRIISQLFDRMGMLLDETVDTRRPERYAENYSQIIESILRTRQQTSRSFRRR